MNPLQKLVVATFAVVGLAVSAGNDVQAACTSVSAQGEGITKEIATEVAKMNLEFAVFAKGSKAAGKMALKCGAPGPLLLTSCTAKQRACS